jgi:hypothetical protein
MIRRDAVGATMVPRAPLIGHEFLASHREETEPVAS